MKVNGLAQHLGTQKCCYKTKSLATKPENLKAHGMVKSLTSMVKISTSQAIWTKEGLAGFPGEKKANVRMQEQEVANPISRQAEISEHTTFPKNMLKDRLLSLKTYRHLVEN